MSNSVQNTAINPATLVHVWLPDRPEAEVMSKYQAYATYVHGNMCYVDLIKSYLETLESTGRYEFTIDGQLAVITTDRVNG